jgi:YVTN family beta-propeller protein
MISMHWSVRSASIYFASLRVSSHLRKPGVLAALCLALVAMLGGALNLAVAQTAQLAVGAVTATIQVGNNPIGVALNPTGTTAYVTNYSDGTVSVIDTATNTVYGPAITVGTNPVNVALNPAGTLAYVTNYGSNSVSVIDTANDANQNTVIATIQVGTNPVGVALNPAGTLAYVVNNSQGSNNGTISVIDTNQNTVIATIPVGANPAYVALNSTGTLVYVTLDDPNGSGGGFTVIDAATNTVTGGIATGNYPVGVALNPTGGLAYVVDSGDNDLAVIGIVANQPFQVLVTIPVGNDPTFVAVNSAGTYAYVTNQSDGTISAISTVTNAVTTIPVGNLPQAIAVNPAGTYAYVTNFGFPSSMGGGGSAVALITLSGTNFGSVNVGSSSASPVPLVFTFNSGGQIGGPVVLTHGAANLDFTDAGGTSHVYVAGDSCVVNGTFTPTAPGGRYGVVELTDSTGNVIATGYVQGTGVGPQVSFPPGVQSTVGGGLNQSSNVAVDASDNVYIADTGNSRVLKETLSDGSYSQSTIGSGLNAPTGVAVDWSGNVYIADNDNGTGLVYKETPSPTGYIQSTISSGPLNLSSIAVDESGNVFLADTIAGSVFEDALSLGSYTQKELIAGLADIVGLTVDGSGNLYITCTCNVNAGSAVIKETLFFGGGYGQSVLDSGFSDAVAVAVDGLGNVYVADSGAGAIYKETLSGGSYTRSVAATTGSMEPDGVAVDGRGNIFFAGISQSGTSTAFKLDLADAPSLSFATTTFGSTSSDSPQTVTVQNNGNAALSFPVPSSGSNPNVGASFTLDSSGASACPLVGAGSSSAETLAAGAICDISISFVPATTGPINDSLILTDNALNATAPNYATQSIALSGTGTQAAQTIAFGTLTSPVTYGVGPIVLSATATSGLNVTFSVVSGPGTISGSVLTVTGTGTIVIAANQGGNANYTAATPVQQNITVTPALPVVELTSSANPALAQNAVTLQATVLSATGTPTGTVTFMDGSTTLGSGTLSAGVAAFTVLSFSVASHAITVVYGGDANFSAATSGTLTELVEDFTFDSSGSGNGTSQTVNPGGSAVFTLTLSPSGGVTLPAAVSLTASGLPAGATATFSPQALPAGSPQSNVTLTIEVPQTATNLHWQNHLGKSIPLVLWGILLLPFASQLRKNGKQMGRLICLLLLLASTVAIAAGLSGCGGSSSTTSQTPQTYTITLTAISGSLSHSTPVTLTVE